MKLASIQQNGGSMCTRHYIQVVRETAVMLSKAMVCIRSVPITDHAVVMWRSCDGHVTVCQGQGM